jgi:hypothetical protein
VQFQRVIILLLAFIVVGCSKSSGPMGDPSKKITWEQFQKMPSEEQADPYILNHLDDEAKKKFDEMVNKQIK